MRPDGTTANVMTVTEAARHLGLSRTRVYQLLEAGRLVRAYTWQGGRMLVDATSVRLYKK